MITFDRAKAFSSMIPIIVFCVLLLIFHWIEDRTGIPVMIFLLFTPLIVIFVLNGLVVA